METSTPPRLAVTRNRWPCAQSRAEERGRKPRWTERESAVGLLLALLLVVLLLGGGAFYLTENLLLVVLVVLVIAALGGVGSRSGWYR